MCKIKTHKFHIHFGQPNHPSTNAAVPTKSCTKSC